jgi:DoxX-like family
MPVVRLIGVVEILGVLGLVLPPWTGVAPALAVTAGIGFVILQVLATGLHLTRGEAKVIGLNLALIVLAAAATWLVTAF